MKINTFKYLMLLVLPLLLFSCSRGEDSELRAKGEGLLSLDCGYDPSPETVTKADDAPVFAIDVKDFNSGVIIKSVADHNSLATEPIKLKAGKYIVVASNGTNVDAAFESPFFEGKDTVEIEAGNTCNAQIECTLANVKVGVAFSEAVTSNFTKYDVTVSNENGGTLVFDKDHITSFGYFKCTGTLKWTVNLTNTDGENFEVSNFITNVKPRQYYSLKLDINGNGSTDQGGASVRITYDATMTVKEHNIDISLNKGAMPTISDASGAVLTELLRAPQGAGVLGVFNINAAAGIVNVKVSHNDSGLTAAGIPTLFSLVDTDPATLAAKGIIWERVTAGATSAVLDISTLLSSILPIGEYSLTISILDNDAQYVEAVLNIKVIPNVEISIVKVDTWGKFAYVYAQYNTESAPAGMGFRYKKTADADWINYTGTLSTNGANYSAKITGLDPNTSYDFQAVSTKDVKEDNIKTSSTSGVSQLPFSNFDTWMESSGAYYPTDDLNNLFFDSANKATGGMGVNPTTQDSDFKVSGSSARLESCSMLGVLAAGNMYTGYFVKRSGTNAKVSFGRPFTDRPLKLKGYYHYAPKPIDIADSDHSGMKGQNDCCQIYIMLTNWTEPWVVDSGQKNFISPTADYVIAYGQLSDDTNSGSNFKEFTIDLTYLKDEKPKYIVVVAASSKLGDYFTGAEGSVLHIDEFSLEYE